MCNKLHGLEHSFASHEHENRLIKEIKKKTGSAKHSHGAHWPLVANTKNLVKLQLKVSFSVTNYSATGGVKFNIA